MAFVKAKIELVNPVVGTGIKVSLKKVRTSVAKFCLSVTGATIKELGWKDGDKLEVLLGEGDDHGMIRLRKNNSVGEAAVTERNAVRGGKYLLIALGNQPAFVDRAEPARWCQWEKIEDGWVEVVLPRWADETAPNRRTVSRNEPDRRPPLPGTEKRADGGADIKTTHSNINTKPFAGAPAQPKKQNVTANLMGDPAPGRREMLQKMGEMKA